MHPFVLKPVRALAAAGILALLSVAARADTIGQRLQDLFGGPSASGDSEILDPANAFRFSAEAAGPQRVTLHWDIAEGYYLYRDKFLFALKGGEAKLDPASVHLPTGEYEEDEVFGRVEVITDQAEVDLILLRGPGPELPVTLSVSWQGCKNKSVCYPPIARDVALVLPALTDAPGSAAAGNAELSAEDAIVQRLRGAGLAGNLVAFFVFGVLLSLTPCIFPMVPILSGIIIGAQRRGVAGKGFALSVAYVVAMAAGYAGFGVLAGSFQINLQAAAQAPWVIVLFSAIFVLLGLSMIGVFQLQMPAGMQESLHRWSERQPPGTLRGAAVMGLLSAVVVGPCVAPPLAGALLYVSQTGNAWLGGATLFSMGVGMGVPLLALGASAGTLLPRAGYWMETLKQVMGVVMLAVAIWFLGRVLPGPATLILWALLLMSSAIFMGALDTLDRTARWRRLWKALGLAMLVYGAVLIIGAASGSNDVFQPLQRLAQIGSGAAEGTALPFRPVANVGELREQLARANLEGRPVMLDFYADWCVTCKEMEQETFPDPRVRALLDGVVLLQADVTANDGPAQELLRTYDLFGPPAILFFDSQARELRLHRVIGFLPADEFLVHLRSALSS
ncbi:MAG: protein-disulfide reductase DsbD [Gammaproteobacteria bacterium]|nr:protein-disulfide reductase DsbD [Gammaproteobacteria bacterium]